MLKLVAIAVTTWLVMATSVHDFKVQGLEGNEINLADYKGKKILIVNTASKCGLTPQYEELEKLYKLFQGKLVVIGFPANNFAGQEPGSNSEIKEFCKRNYGVTFPMAEKISVTGDDIHPLFKYLTDEAVKAGMEAPVVKWNFTKFLVDENGKLVKVFPSKVKPLSEEIMAYLN